MMQPKQIRRQWLKSVSLATQAARRSAAIRLTLWTVVVLAVILALARTSLRAQPALESATPRPAKAADSLLPFPELRISLTVPWDFESTPVEELDDFDAVRHRTDVRLLAVLSPRPPRAAEAGTEVVVRALWYPASWRTIFLSEPGRFEEMQLGGTTCIRLTRVPLPFGERLVGYIVPVGESCVLFLAPLTQRTGPHDEAPTNFQWAIERIIATSKFATPAGTASASQPTTGPRSR